MKSLRKNALYDSWAGLLVVHLKVVCSSSLKDRRRVVRSLLDRIRGRWNVSAEDMGPDNEKTDVILAFSTVGREVAAIVERWEAVRSFIRGEEEFGEFDLVDFRQEVNRFEYFGWNDTKAVLSHGEDQ